jgi:hypothetical protein
MGVLTLRNQDASMPSLTVGQRRQVWDSLLDADMSVRYWRHLASRYHRYDMSLKTAVLCFSSGAVVAFLMWLELGWLWKFLTVLTACLSAVSLVLNIPGRTEAMTELAGKWTALMHAHENLWNVVDITPAESVLTKYAELQRTEVELSRTECRLPSSIQRLKERAAGEVRRARGLPPREQRRS